MDHPHLARLLVSLAAEAGCAKVCIFVRAPEQGIPDRDGDLFHLRAVSPDDVDAMIARMKECSVSIMNAEFFPLEPDTDIDSYIPALELACALGAERIVTHVHDTNEERAIASLARLTDLAGEHGLKVGLEFMGLSPGCNSLSKANRLVADLNRDNLGIAIDALHFIRTGGSVNEVAALDPRHIAYVQLCDGAHLDLSCDYLSEAFDRLAPMEGVFPLKALIAALPTNVDLDVEVPSRSGEKRGEPALDRVRHAVAACRDLLDDLERPRGPHQHLSRAAI